MKKFNSLLLVLLTSLLLIDCSNGQNSGQSAVESNEKSETANELGSKDNFVSADESEMNALIDKMADASERDDAPTIQNCLSQLQSKFSINGNPVLQARITEGYAVLTAILMEEAEENPNKFGELADAISNFVSCYNKFKNNSGFQSEFEIEDEYVEQLFEIADNFENIRHDVESEFSCGDDCCGGDDYSDDDYSDDDYSDNDYSDNNNSDNNNSDNNNNGTASIIECSDKIFSSDVISNGKIRCQKPFIIDFNATWCGPCQQLRPILERLQKQYGSKILIFSVDVDKCPNASDQFGVESLPTILFFNPSISSSAVHKAVGFTSESELKNIISRKMKVQ